MLPQLPQQQCLSRLDVSVFTAASASTSMVASALYLQPILHVAGYDSGSIPASQRVTFRHLPAEFALLQKANQAGIVTGAFHVFISRAAHAAIVCQECLRWSAGA
jgi:hypothetical protein